MASLSLRPADAPTPLLAGAASETAFGLVRTASNGCAALLPKLRAATLMLSPRSSPRDPDGKGKLNPDLAEVQDERWVLANARFNLNQLDSLSERLLRASVEGWASPLQSPRSVSSPPPSAEIQSPSTEIQSPSTEIQSPSAEIQSPSASPGGHRDPDAASDADPSHAALRRSGSRSGSHSNCGGRSSSMRPSSMRPSSAPGHASSSGAGSGRMGLRLSRINEVTASNG